jgi:hypothetical protein
MQLMVIELMHCGTVCGSIPESENIPKISRFEGIAPGAKIHFIDAGVIFNPHAINSIPLNFQVSVMKEVNSISIRIVGWYKYKFITSEHL